MEQLILITFHPYLLNVPQSLANTIVSLNAINNRIVACDIQESFHFIRYKRTQNQLSVFADDSIPRWIICSIMLDYNTIAGADKFGNIVVVSLLLFFF